MERRLFWRLGVIALVGALLGISLTVTARAAFPRQGEEPVSPGIAAMRAACQTSDMDAMTKAMESLTNEDWQAMAAHMSNGNHRGHSSHMMDNGERMNMHGMTGMRGMMGGASGRGMMGMMGW